MNYITYSGDTIYSTQGRLYRDNTQQLENYLTKEK